MSCTQWSRSRTVWPDAAHIVEDDWTLVDESGEKLARIFDLERDDGVEDGNWRWRIYRRDGLAMGGSAIDGKTAKRECERRIADGK